MFQHNSFLQQKAIHCRYILDYLGRLSHFVQRRLTLEYSQSTFPPDVLPPPLDIVLGQPEYNKKAVSLILLLFQHPDFSCILRRYCLAASNSPELEELKASMPKLVS